MKYVCQNCQEQWDADDLEPLKDVEERVAPGEPMPAGECPDCGAVCHGVKMRYNHAFHMAFEVITESENPDNITEHEILAGLLDRVAGFLRGENDTMQACEPYDMYVCERHCKYCEKKIEDSDKTAHIHREEWVCSECWDGWDK